MKNIKELNKSKVPIVKLDKSLDKLNDVVLFTEKVDKAKQTIEKIGLPKNRQSRWLTAMRQCWRNIDTSIKPGLSVSVKDSIETKQAHKLLNKNLCSGKGFLL